MSFRHLFMGTLAICGSFAVAGFAAPTQDAMRAASAVQINAKYSSSLCLTKDADGNIISFHVNGVSPEDAGILLTRDISPLSTEYVIITGINKEGGASVYMLPTGVATAHVVESISQDLVNSGAISIQISKQQNGKA